MKETVFSNSHGLEGTSRSHNLLVFLHGQHERCWQEKSAYCTVIRLIPHCKELPVLVFSVFSSCKDSDDDQGEQKTAMTRWFLNLNSISEFG